MKYKVFIEEMLHDVIEFRNAFGLDVESDFLIGEDISLHDSLVVEELREIAEAKSDIERLDGIVDTVYVLLGQVAHSRVRLQAVSYFVGILIDVAYSFGYSLKAAWAEVHQSNMSKPCINFEEAKKSRDEYMQLETYTDIEIIALAGYFILVNDKDVKLTCGKAVKKGKVLKSINYRKPDLTKMI